MFDFNSTVGMYAEPTDEVDSFSAGLPGMGQNFMDNMVNQNPNSLFNNMMSVLQPQQGQSIQVDEMQPRPQQQYPNQGQGEWNREGFMKDLLKAIMPMPGM